MTFKQLLVDPRFQESDLDSQLGYIDNFYRASISKLPDQKDALELEGRLMREGYEQKVLARKTEGDERGFHLRKFKALNEANRARLNGDMDSAQEFLKQRETIGQEHLQFTRQKENLSNVDRMAELMSELPLGGKEIKGATDLMNAVIETGLKGPQYQAARKLVGADNRFDKFQEGVTQLRAEVGEEEFKALTEQVKKEVYQEFEGNVHNSRWGDPVIKPRLALEDDEAIKSSLSAAGIEEDRIEAFMQSQLPAIRKGTVELLGSLKEIDKDEDRKKLGDREYALALMKDADGQNWFLDFLQGAGATMRSLTGGVGALLGAKEFGDKRTKQAAAMNVLMGSDGKEFIGQLGGAAPDLILSLLPGGLAAKSSRVKGILGKVPTVSEALARNPLLKGARPGTTAAQLAARSSQARAGLAGAAAGSGASAAIRTFGQASEEGLGWGESFGLALKQFFITSGVTLAGGATGVEAVFKRGGVGRGELTSFIKATLKDVPENMTKEGIEEASDELLSFFAVERHINPDATLEQAAESVSTAFQLGAVLGGVVPVAKAAIVDVPAARRADAAGLIETAKQLREMAAEPPPLPEGAIAEPETPVEPSQPPPLPQTTTEAQTPSETPTEAEMAGEAPEQEAQVTEAPATESQTEVDATTPGATQPTEAAATQGEAPAGTSEPAVGPGEGAAPAGPEGGQGGGGEAQVREVPEAGQLAPSETSGTTQEQLPEMVEISKFDRNGRLSQKESKPIDQAYEELSKRDQFLREPAVAQAESQTEEGVAQQEGESEEEVTQAPNVAFTSEEQSISRTDPDNHEGSSPSVKRIQGYPAPTDPVRSDSEVLSTASVNPVPLNVDPAPDVEPIHAPAVMRSLDEIIRSVALRVPKAIRGRFPTRVGRLQRKDSLGEFWVRPKVIRIRTANDISTAAHETAHALENAIFGPGHVWDSGVGVSNAAQAELTKLGKDLYPGARPDGGWRSEGFAEFFRLLVEGGDAEARKMAPEFFNYFDQEFLNNNSQLSKRIRKSQQAAKRFSEQGGANRTRESLFKESWGEKISNLQDILRNAPSALMTKLVESGAPLKDLVVASEHELGRKLSTTEDPFATQSARRLTHDSAAAYMVENGMIDFAHNKVGMSLKQAVAPAKNNWGDFLVYLYAKRAVALWTGTKTDPNTGAKIPNPRNPGVSLDDALQFIKEVETPEFKRAAQNVYDWNDGVLRYAAEASPDYKKVVDQLLADPDRMYVPLFREFSSFDKIARSTSAASGQLFKKLRGSGRRVKNPIESMIAQARSTVLKANQKAVLDQIVKLANNVPGLGHLVTEVPKDRLPAASRSVQDMIDEVNKRLPPGEELSLPAGADPDEMVTFFTVARFPIKQGEDPIFPVYSDGKVRWLEMDRSLYDSLAGMDLKQLPRWADLILGVPTRMFRLGTTGLRASFSLVTNPLRDFRTMMLNSQAQANTGELFIDWIKEMKNAFLYSVSGGRYSTEFFDAYERISGKMASTLGQDMRPTKRAARRLGEGWVMRTIDFGSHLDYVRDVLQFPELATRTVELKRVAKDIGWDPSQPITLEQSYQLANATKQVTTDFTAAGHLARTINQMVPFFNAGIQGPRAHIRAARRNPAKFFRRALYGTALALAQWYRYKDEEWWDEMTPEERYGYTYFPFEFNGRKELIRIPRSFEVDGIFMAGAQSLAEAWHKEDPKAMDEWFSTFVTSTNPISAPVIIEEAAEQMMNRDFYFKSPIVPEGELRRVAPEEQIGPNTTKAAIFLSELANNSLELTGKGRPVSPRRVDHAIRGIFGGVGSDLSSLFGRGETVNRESELADTPVLGTIFQRGGQAPRRSKSMGEFYELLDEARMLQASRKKEESRKQRELRLMLEDAGRAISAISDVRNLQWTVEERRKMDAKRTEIAREAVNLYSKEVPKRSLFQREARTQERQVERLERQSR